MRKGEKTSTALKQTKNSDNADT
ncbi:23S rRNA methyltransferase attenuation leader peptide [Enterococcus faecalis]